MVFLSKTKKSKLEMEETVGQLGNYFGVFVDARGRSGRLVLLWDKKADLTLLSYSSHHIDSKIQWGAEEPTWRLTGVYGWSKTQHKHRTGSMINDLKTHSDLPWLIDRDLNEIFYHEEKRWGPL